MMTSGSNARRAHVCLLMVVAALGAAACGAAGAEPAPAGALPATTTPHPVRHAAAHHRRRAVPAVPPIAPAAVRGPAPPPAVGSAPVPNEAVAAPIPNASTATSVAPSVFSLHYPPQGDGYVTGSSPQAMDDRNAAKATGVQVTVPLQQ